MFCLVLAQLGGPTQRTIIGLCVCVFQNSFDWIAFPIPPVTPTSNGAVQILDACFCLITVALWVAVSIDIRVASVAVVCL